MRPVVFSEHRRQAQGFVWFWPLLGDLFLLEAGPWPTGFPVHFLDPFALRSKLLTLAQFKFLKLRLAGCLQSGDCELCTQSPDEA